MFVEAFVFLVTWCSVDGVQRSQLQVTSGSVGVGHVMEVGHSKGHLVGGGHSLKVIWSFEYSKESFLRSYLRWAHWKVL